MHAHTYTHTQAHKSPDLPKFIKMHITFFLARKTLPACALRLTEGPKGFPVEGQEVVVTAEGTVSHLVREFLASRHLRFLRRKHQE